MIKLKDILDEGAWGHGPLDNDSASDWKWKFGDMIMKEIKSKLKGDDFGNKYHAIGMWEYFRNTLKTQYSFFSDDDITEMNKLIGKIAKEILDSDSPKSPLATYEKPDIIRGYLLGIIDDGGSKNIGK